MRHSVDDLVEEVLARLQGVKREGRQFKAICPAHADGTPSLSIRAGERGVLLRCYAGCTHVEVAEAIGYREEELFYDYDPDRAAHERRDKREAPAEPPADESTGLTRAAFAEQRKLDEAKLASLGVTDGVSSGKRVVLFDYRSRTGVVGRQRIRIAMTGNGRFRWQTGDAPVIAYEPDGGALAKAQKRLIIVEGESDCLTLVSQGFPALGLPGADMAKLIEPAHVEGIDHVFIVREPDKGGDSFARNVPFALERLGYKGQTHTIRMFAETKDVSALYVRDPVAFSAAFTERLENACPPRSKSLESLFAMQADESDVVHTSLSELDRSCDDGGIPLGILMVCVGGPGSRKTGLGVQLADDISQQGCAVLFVCADEGRKNIVTRLGQRMGFSRAGLRDRTEIGAATRAEAARRERALGRVLRFAELDDDEDAQTLEDAHLELINVAKGKPRVLIVDSLQTCRSEAAEALERPDPRQEIDRKMRTLRAFRRAGTLVIVISETRRGFYSQVDRRIEKEDVISAAKESGGVEFGADLVLGLVRDREDENKLELVVAKSRIGREPRFQVKWDRQRASLDELTPQESAVEPVSLTVGKPRSDRDQLRADVYELVLRQPGINQGDIRAAFKRGRELIKEVLDELAFMRRITASAQKRGVKTTYTACVPGQEPAQQELDHEQGEAAP